MSGVPFIDLGRAHEPLQPELAATFERIARSGAFTLAAELDEFERQFAAYCEAPRCIGVCDGTEAIRLALLALGVGPGAEVITVPSTFIATVEAIAGTGATPVLVDIDPVTRCMDAERVADAVGPKTAAIVPVHLYGSPAPIDEIQAAGPDLPIVEDAAQAHGYPLRGAVATYSFYPTKNLGALGDGGAVVCRDDEVADAVRSLRHHGSAPDDANLHLRHGATSRLDNLQAALLSVKLPHLDEWNAQRREAAARYREALAGLPLDLPPEEGVFHLFAVEVDERDRVRDALREAGVGAAVHYPRPAHLNPAWSHLGSAGDFPAAERLAKRTLSLPMFPGITDEEIDQVAEALRAQVT